MGYKVNEILLKARETIRVLTVKIKQHFAIKYNETN